MDDSAQTALAQVRPTERRRIIDLLREAGIDVSHWGDFDGGQENAASNPRFCYEWSFVDPGKLVVLNLWHEAMDVQGDSVFQTFNPREGVLREPKSPGRGVRQKRALNMDRAIGTAFKEGLPVRVVVCDGKRRKRTDPNSKASRVEKRLLDPVSWAVTSYDTTTGQCTVTRGTVPDPFADQFSLLEESAGPPERRPVSGEAFVRNPEVRRNARLRARGICDWCGQTGFTMPSGKIFLETHHVVPLSEHGLDNARNVAALCPNHHREAHYGANRNDMRDELLRRLGNR